MPDRVVPDHPVQTPEELAERRRDRATEADERLRRLFAVAAPGHAEQGSGSGLALVAVGGYGRAELSPASDLDVVLVHDGRLAPERVGEIAEAIWYPLWDDGVVLDHAVRSSEEMLAAAEDDHRAATGMLDARAVAGDTSLVLALRSGVLAQWRRTARRRLPELRQASRDRVERAGWLAHAAVPDLKESGGGLRDGVVMRALVATWLVDIRHGEVEAMRASLLDVRDALHQASGRRSDRFSPDLVPEVARLLGRDPDELDLHVRDLGRRTAHLAGLAWRQVDQVVSEGGRARRPIRLEVVTAGVARLGDEIVLARGADPAHDAGLAVRAAAAAAEARIPLSSSSADRLGRTGASAPEPWAPEMRRHLVDLLGSGPGLVRVWEELDIAGVVERWLPEWDSIRLRGSSSPVHRFTIDRHSLETCVNATALLRTVARPDLLLVAALVHDIGKGRPGDHSEVGEPLAREIALRWGFDATDADRVAHLVRWHLLLPNVATRRDIEDPGTSAGVAEVVGDVETLGLLAALSESDARATSAAAWSTWRAGLVKGLVAKVRSVLETGAPIDDPAAYDGWSEELPVPAGDLEGDGIAISTEPHRDGSLVRIAARDRGGLMADLAAGLALAGMPVLSARVWSQDGVARTTWETPTEDVDVARLKLRIRRVLDGTVDLDQRLGVRAEEDTAAPVVTLLETSSRTATVLEVRTRDRRGLVWTVCRAIAQRHAEIRSAHLSTFGPEARDVFYVVDSEGGALLPGVAEELRRHLLDALA
ncbi:[protein-PII] uridylyltransferase [Solicola sp. PLA-1-18]|uniref:[protein-PII] uridylyltransferase n=1 Tax=Solicola sp. PLA-1-18 TaxID=3380532 RepID=UPI003B787E80